MNGVSHQMGVDSLEAGGIFEDNIGRVLALAHAPVIRPQAQVVLRSQPGIDSLSQTIQPDMPISGDETIHQFLGSGQIVYVGEAIVAFFVSNARFVQTPGQPFPAVDAHLNGERKPSLQPDMHQTELAIDVVEVDVKAWSIGCSQLELLLLPVGANLESPGGLDTGQNANEAFLNVIPLCNFASDLFLGGMGRRKIFVRSPLCSGIGLGLLFYPVRELFCQRSEVLEQYVPSGEPYFHGSTAADRAQASFEEDAIETCYNALDSASVPFPKTLHDCPPLVVSVKYIMPEDIMERYYFFSTEVWNA